MPLDMKTTRTVTRTVSLDLTQAEIEEAIRQFIVNEQRKLKDWDLSIRFNHHNPADDTEISAAVSATTTAERGS